MKIRNLAVGLIGAGLLAGSSASAALTPLDSSSFTKKFEMNGSTTILPDDNDAEWSYLVGGGSYTGNQAGGQLYLSTHFPPDNSGNASIYLESDTFPSANSPGGASTVEVSVQVTESSTDTASDRAFGMLVGDGGGYGNLEVGLTTVRFNGSEIASGLNNSDGQHIYRVARDGSNGFFYVFRDGVALANDLGWISSAADTLYFGDATGGWNGSSYVDYIRWTTDGAYSPVPEPAAGVTAMALGALALWRRRRA
jgi:MYXO-CTERM domain-containing protein